VERESPEEGKQKMGQEIDISLHVVLLTLISLDVLLKKYTDEE